MVATINAVTGAVNAGVYCLSRHEVSMLNALSENGNK